VGQGALAERLGRNQRFASIGGLAAAAIMGVVGYLLSTADIFLVTAAFGIPVIFGAGQDTRSAMSGGMAVKAGYKYAAS
jgi:hypothetical protein